MRVCVELGACHKWQPSDICAGHVSASEERVLVSQEELQDLKGVWAELSKMWQQIDELKERPWMSVQPRKVYCNRTYHQNSKFCSGTLWRVTAWAVVFFGIFYTINDRRLLVSEWVSRWQLAAATSAAVTLSGRSSNGEWRMWAWLKWACTGAGQRLAQHRGRGRRVAAAGRITAASTAGFDWGVLVWF